MYRIPQELDLTKIIGEFTTQFCVGKYDIQFSLGEMKFGVQSEIEIIESGKIVGVWRPERWPDGRFLEIINMAVSKTEIPDDRTIILHFENGLEMHLHDNSDQYESMQIFTKEVTWVI